MQALGHAPCLGGEEITALLRTWRLASGNSITHGKRFYPSNNAEQITTTTAGGHVENFRQPADTIPPAALSWAEMVGKDNRTG